MLSVPFCPSFTSISRRSLKTKRWNKQHKQISIFARICIEEDLVLKLRSRVMAWFWIISMFGFTPGSSPWLAIWTFLKTKVQTIDCLQACRFDLYYRICMVGPEKSRQRAMAKPTAISLACWFCSHAHLIGFCVCITAVCMACCTGWLSSLYVVRASLLNM